MQSRRNFIGKVATGLAGTLAASNVLRANDRIRIGIIGPGARGSEILREAVSLPNVECVGAADVYTRRLEDVKKIAPDAKTYLDYRHLLEDSSVDAVPIATPQHLHSEHFVAALEAGKHVYQEKTMAFTVEHAKRMRAAVKRTDAGQLTRSSFPERRSAFTPGTSIDFQCFRANFGIAQHYLPDALNRLRGYALPDKIPMPCSVGVATALPGDLVQRALPNGWVLDFQKRFGLSIAADSWPARPVRRGCG
ncbi:MAG: Gfo/Idh/MocA family protein [Bryobacteraceae bacterium]